MTKMCVLVNYESLKPKWKFEKSVFPVKTTDVVMICHSIQMGHPQTNPNALQTQYEDEWSDVQVNNSILIAWQWKPILIILGIEIDDTIISVLSKHQFARMWFAHRIIISIIIIRLVLVSAENSIHLFWALSPGIYFWLI